MVKTFLIEKPIDYKEQRNEFIAFLKSKLAQRVNAGRSTFKVQDGIEIYDDIMSFVGDAGQVVTKYSYFHEQIEKFEKNLKMKTRLYIKDDGNNALFIFKGVHDNFTLKFYVEFKSIYDDVEKMRIARIARKIVQKG